MQYTGELFADLTQHFAGGGKLFFFLSFFACKSDAMHDRVYNLSLAMTETESRVWCLQSKENCWYDHIPSNVKVKQSSL